MLPEKSTNLEKTLRSQIVSYLTEQIVSGELKPGMKLTESEIALKLGVSRGPIREAIRELVETGLVISLPYKGIHVRDITEKDLMELYSMRINLEQFAFKIAWNKRNEESIIKLQNLQNQLRNTIDLKLSQQAIVNELELHNWIYDLSDHSLLIECWKKIRPNLQFYFALHQRAHERLGPARDSHDKYVELAQGNDLELMTEYLNEHMQLGLNKVKNFLFS